MPQLRVQALSLHFLDHNRIGAPQQRQAVGRHLAQDPHREPRTREWLSDHELLVEPHLAPDLAHLVLEQLAQRLDQRHPHPVRQAAHVVVALDHRRLTDDGNRFDDIGIERALREKVDLAELRGFRLEDVDEGGADGFALLLGIGHAGEPLEEER